MRLSIAPFDRRSCVQFWSMLAMQHDHHDLVVSSLHTHLDHDSCMESVILRGKFEVWMTAFEQSERRLRARTRHSRPTPNKAMQRSQNPQPELEQRLVAMVRSSEALMSALVAARSLGLSSWCIGAGAVRSLVWDALHGFEQPSAIEDVDVVYFDGAATDPEQDAYLERRLRSAMPALRWEVTNQATVHHWFASNLGQVVPSLGSLEEGVATWPEFATCVGVSLDNEESIGVVAPHGLDDLFSLRVRHNPLRASVATYRQRVASKRFGERWPLLSIEEC